MPIKLRISSDIKNQSCSSVYFWESLDEDARGTWVDVDDLNDIEVDGKMQNDVHYNRPEGYITLGQRLARQGYALIKG